METPASNRLGLAEPVSRTEGTNLAEHGAWRRSSGIHRRRPAWPAGREVQADIPAGSTPSSSSWPRTRVHSGAALSVCALGGYGRRSLCLHSDIDLLILFEHPMSSSDERFVGSLLQPLWDLGLTVGQHVRELPEIVDAAALDMSNAEFLLALLDVRFIAGDERLFQRLEGWLQGLGADNRRRLLDALLQLVDERHARSTDRLPAGAGHQERSRGLGTSRRPGTSGC